MYKPPYPLSKTKILSGTQCKKKLWFDTHTEQEKTDKALFQAGRRFGLLVRKHYGPGLDLTYVSSEQAVADTAKAVKDPTVSVIFEGAFVYNDTLIRADVLIKKDHAWTILEAKTSSQVNDNHILDVSIQSHVAKQAGLNINCVKLIHINNNFVYQGDNNYADLIVEEDITKKVLEQEKEIDQAIKQLQPITDEGFACPDIPVGLHCDKPFACPYKHLCETEEYDPINVSYKILPYLTDKIKKYCESNQIKKLKDVPLEYLQSSRKDYAKNFHQIIQNCHQHQKPWFSDEVATLIKSYEWPFYFMDFETVKQAVPLIKDTKPNDPLPFQWSIHKWSHLEEVVQIEDYISFLQFDDPNIIENFLHSLLEALGTKGTIFAHNASFEKTRLRELQSKSQFQHLESQITSVINRIVDTLEIVRLHFYAPEMQGKYSIKNIVNAIPTKIRYAKNEDGMGAQLSWFIVTDPETSIEVKEKEKGSLLQYCAKDTYAMYDLIKFLIQRK